MIICEGMDNSGKSTLAYKIREHFGLEHEPSPGPPKSVTELLGRITTSLSREVISEVVYDRHSVVTERVYGSVLRGEDRLDNKVGWGLTRRVFDTKPLIIYCRPEEKYIYRWGMRDQMDGIKAKARELVKKYDETYFWLTRTSCYTVVYDYNRSNINDIWGVISEYLERKSNGISN